MFTFGALVNNVYYYLPLVGRADSLRFAVAVSRLLQRGLKRQWIWPNVERICDIVDKILKILSDPAVIRQ